MATKWVDLSRTLAEGDAVEIRARASLDKLHALWSLRMTQRVPFQVSAPSRSLRPMRSVAPHVER
jgi:hypothetical protein